ncbi:MAG TPA: hypothetical protein PK177_18875, partial [Burkholderiaceae bacterium]|nr:hypothetical protein [Burkholderiaceae bacterium]
VRPHRPAAEKQISTTEGFPAWRSDSAATRLTRTVAGAFARKAAGLLGRRTDFLRASNTGCPTGCFAIVDTPASPHAARLECSEGRAIGGGR